MRGDEAKKDEVAILANYIVIAGNSTAKTVGKAIIKAFGWVPDNGELFLFELTEQYLFLRRLIEIATVDNDFF